MTDETGLVQTRVPPNWSSIARHFKFMKEMFDEVNIAEGRPPQQIRALNDREILSAELLKADEVDGTPLRILSLGMLYIVTNPIKLCRYHSSYVEKTAVVSVA